ncbi:MAG: DUF1345 domain-containing protein [Candidatus Eremiobacteraeota bacterium]|nr:DUF1345 domain-containing protein [Candidatus Eremiobacteraeota bacterium]
MPRRGRRRLRAPAAADLHRAARRRTRHRTLSFGLAIVAGLAAWFVEPGWISSATRFVGAYDAATLTLIALLWLRGMHDDPVQTRMRAATQDPGRNAISIVVLTVVTVGLVAAVAIIGRGPHVANASEKWLAYGLGVSAIALGWFLVHTIYTFRYAHLYWFDDDGDGFGGIRFPGDTDPCDYDFAYFAFCIGTSFAVSDPQVTDTRIRREVIVHSIISFAYNSIIIGMVINLFAGLFSGGGGDSGH